MIRWLIAVLILVAAVVAVIGEASRRSDVSQGRVLTDAERQARIAKARTAEAEMRVIVRTDTVRVRVARWDTIYRDTGQRITDTIWVKAALAVADSTIRACTELANDCQQFREAAGASFRAYEAHIAALQSELNRAKRQNFLKRFGVNVGYGVQVPTSGVVTTGPQLNVGFRIWP